MEDQYHGPLHPPPNSRPLLEQHLGCRGLYRNTNAPAQHLPLALLERQRFHLRREADLVLPREVGKDDHPFKRREASPDARAGTEGEGHVSISRPLVLLGIEEPLRLELLRILAPPLLHRVRGPHINPDDRPLRHGDIVLLPRLEVRPLQNSIPRTPLRQPHFSGKKPQGLAERRLRVLEAGHIFAVGDERFLRVGGGKPIGEYGVCFCTELLLHLRVKG